MRRTYLAEAFTDDELANLRAGKCWCGKPRSEFGNGMRVYCSPDHRSIWYSKSSTWSQFRNDYLQKHGKFCDQCGRKELTWEDRARPRSKAIRAYVVAHPEILKRVIAERVRRAEEDFERDLKRAYHGEIDDDDLRPLIEASGEVLPPPIRGETDDFEVDHKVAIVNGGREFDEANLQVLCHRCHVGKTKSDMVLRDSTLLMKKGQRLLDAAGMSFRPAETELPSVEAK